MDRRTRDAYEWIHILETEMKGNKRAEQRIIELKRQVRAWNKLNEREHIVHEDGYGSYIRLEDAPEWCKTEQDVIDWFEEEAWIHCPNSQYDCTGRRFTNWYKPVFRQGHWMVYHSIGFDI